MRALMGLPVIHGGRRVGRVCGVKLDGRLQSLEGLWLDIGFMGGRFLGREDIELLGDVSVLAHGRGRRERKAGKTPMYRAVSPGGQILGCVTDAFVDGESLRVEAVELSRGFWDDLTRGRRRVSEFQARDSGEVVVDAPEEGGGEE